MKKFLIISLIIFLILAITIILNGIYCNNHLEFINYKFSTDKLKTNIHFVVVSDQHNNEFGENNSELIDKIKSQNPDFVCVCGDMVTRGNTSTEVMKKFLSQLSELFPTYCVLGNHEQSMAQELDFTEIYKSTGATLLDDDYIEFKKDGEIIRIGGLTDYPYYEMYAPDFNNRDALFWESFNKGSADNYTIMLHHQPEYIPGILADSNIDLVLCGHTHGGLVRIPFIGGLIAPNQGFLPEYDKGLFKFGNTNMVVGSGLAGAGLLPRVNNCAEITVIDVN